MSTGTTTTTTNSTETTFSVFDRLVWVRNHHHHCEDDDENPHRNPMNSSSSSSSTATTTTTTTMEGPPAPPLLHNESITTGSTDNTTTADGHNNDNDHCLWIPAIHYQSHTELVEQHLMSQTSSTTTPSTTIVPVVSSLSSKSSSRLPPNSTIRLSNHRNVQRAILLNYFEETMAKHQQEQQPPPPNQQQQSPPLQIPILQFLPPPTTTTTMTSATSSSSLVDFRAVTAMDVIEFDFFGHFIHMNQNGTSTTTRQQYSTHYLPVIYQLLQQQQPSSSSSSSSSLPLLLAGNLPSPLLSRPISTVPAVSNITKVPVPPSPPPPPQQSPTLPLVVRPNRVSLSDGNNDDTTGSTTINTAATTVIPSIIAISGDENQNHPPVVENDTYPEQGMRGGDNKGATFAAAAASGGKQDHPHVVVNEISQEKFRGDNEVTTTFTASIAVESGGNHNRPHAVGNEGNHDEDDVDIEPLSNDSPSNSTNHEEETTTTQMSLSDQIKIGINDTLGSIKQQLLQTAGWTYKCVSVTPHLVYDWIPPFISGTTSTRNCYTGDDELQAYIVSQFPHWKGGKITKKNTSLPTHQSDEDIDEEEDDETSALSLSQQEHYNSDEQDEDGVYNDDRSDTEDEENDVEPPRRTKSMPRPSSMKYASKKRKSLSLTSRSSDARNSKKSKCLTGKKKDTVKPLSTNKKSGKTVQSNKVIRTPTTKKANKKQPPPSPHWWKHENLPTMQQIRPLLQTIGFTYNPGTKKYQFPNDAIHCHSSDETDKNNSKVPLVAMGYNGLRKFLCCYGIPPVPEVVSTSGGDDTGNNSKRNLFSKLSEKQREILRRWIVFANVPIHINDQKSNVATKKELRNIGSPKNRDQLLTKLYALGFSTVDAKLFVPEYKQMSNYQNNKPIHEKHYFYLETELYTKVRWYVRQSWHLGVVTTTTTTTSNDDSITQDGIEQYYSDIKRMRANAKYYETVLYVRLWAAASSQPLPTYSTLPDDMHLQPFLLLPDDENENSCNNDMDDEENNDVADSSKVMDVSSTRSPDDDETAKDETSVTSIESDCSSDHDNNPEWYLYQPIPDFLKQIWPILGKLQFHFKSGQYGHPNVPEPIGNSTAVQQFCARYGIPGYDTTDCLDDKEQLLLFRWAAFAQVNVRKSNSIETLSTVKCLNTAQIRKLLIALTFQIIDDKFYIPGADNMVGGRSDRQHGVHYFNGMEQIRGYIRGAPDFGDATNTRRRADPRRREKPSISQDDMLAIRLWAATSNQPLPTFQPMNSASSTSAKSDGNNSSKHYVDDKEATIFLVCEDDDDKVTINHENDTELRDNPLQIVLNDADEDIIAIPSNDVATVDIDDQNWHTPSQGSDCSPTKILFSESIQEIDLTPLNKSLEMADHSQGVSVAASTSTSPADKGDFGVVDPVIQEIDLTPLNKSLEMSDHSQGVFVDASASTTPGDECDHDVIEPVIQEIDSEPLNKSLEITDHSQAVSVDVSVSNSPADECDHDVIEPVINFPMVEGGNIEHASDIEKENGKRVSEQITRERETEVVSLSKRFRCTTVESDLVRACRQNSPDDDILEVEAIDHSSNIKCYFLTQQDVEAIEDVSDDIDDHEMDRTTDGNVAVESFVREAMTAQDNASDDDNSEEGEIVEGRTTNHFQLFTQFDPDDDREREGIGPTTGQIMMGSTTTTIGNDNMAGDENWDMYAGRLPDHEKDDWQF